MEKEKEIVGANPCLNPMTTRSAKGTMEFDSTDWS